MRALLGLFLVLLLISASQEQNPPAAECTKVEKLPTEPTTQEEFLELLEQMLQDVLVIFDTKKKEFTIELDANPINLPGSAWLRALEGNECVQMLLQAATNLAPFVEKTKKKESECLVIADLKQILKILNDANLFENINCLSNAIDAKNVAETLKKFDEVVTPLRDALSVVKQKNMVPVEVKDGENAAEGALVSVNGIPIGKTNKVGKIYTKPLPSCETFKIEAKKDKKSGEKEDFTYTPGETISTVSIALA